MKIGMFGRIVLAILGGVALGFLLVHAGTVGTVGLRILKTFNVLFAQVLKFIVPLLILGLVTPAIADAGRGAGKLLVTVMVLSYLSTCAAALFAYFSAGQLLPLYVVKGAIATAGKGVEILPYVDLKIPPLCDVLTALALAFMIGVGAIVTGSESVKRWFEEFGEIVKLTIMRVIIPGLPIYIMTMICEMTASGKIGAMAGTMFKVIGTGWALTLVFLVLLYSLAGLVAKRNPLVCLWNMGSAYLTALSIASSSAVIPVTLECCERNGISKDVRNFVVPLCANVHMVGSAIKMITSALAVVIIYGLDVGLAQVVHFTFLFAIAAVAAPGVMCGVLMASVGFVESVLGLTSEQIAVMMALYMALDGYGPAANVTGDGAVALVCERFFGRTVTDCPAMSAKHGTKIAKGFCLLAGLAFLVPCAFSESALTAGSIDAMGVNGVGLAKGDHAIGFRAVALLPHYGYVDGRLLFGHLLRLGPYDPDGGYGRTEWAVPQTKEAVRKALRFELYHENAIPVPDYAEDEAAKMRLEWTFDGTTVVARVSSDRPAEALLLFNGNVTPAHVLRGDSSSAELAQGGFTVAFAWSGEVMGSFVTADSLGEVEAPARGLAEQGRGDRVGAVRVRISPERPVRIAMAESRVLLADAAADARIGDGERALKARTMTSGGSAAGCADALERLVGFCAVYDTRTGRRFVPVNRDWAGENGHPPTFMWDNFFDSYLACPAHPGLAKESLTQILGVIETKGMEKAPSQRNLIVPVVYSKLVRMVGDEAFTRKTFPTMMKFIRFWFADRGDGRPWRDGNRDGLIENGSCLRPGEADLGRIVSDAFDETGYDDNPQYSAGFGYRRWGVSADGVEYDFDRGTLNLTPVGQNCLYVTACRAMAVVADEIGAADDAAYLRGEAARVAGLVRSRLYNPASGIFENQFFDGRFQGVLTHDTFTPLAAGVADAETALRLKAILTDPQKFWGENPVPTVSYDDPSFGDCTRPGADGYWKGNYWRGNVWPSTDYIVYTALRATDWTDVRHEYVRRCRRMFMDDWEAHHHANENYPPFGATHASQAFAGNGGRDAHYIWSGLLPLQALEELFSVEDTEKGLRFGAADPAGFGSWDGFFYRGLKGTVSIDEKGVRLALGNHLRVETDKPAAFRRFVWSASGWQGDVSAPAGVSIRVVVDGVEVGRKSNTSRTGG